MSQKPVHIVRASGLLQGRDAVWQCIRELKTFTLVDIETMSSNDKNMGDVDINKVARLYVKSLEKAGFLKQHERENGRSRLTWTLLKDVGIHAPRVKRDGTKVVQGSSQQQMWQTMRILRQFNAKDLVINAATEEQEIHMNTASEYIYHLHKAGYLVETSPAHNGGGIARYQLLPGMNTGPKPPMIQRIKQVFDANLNKVVWPKQEEA